ncbi:hypothetical protein Nepgr_002039 [Nepenthes gracilis]|uniref:Uncharacterized protein n=1 Tax=Nepenthes gracilis TaxID=150966 RepID=A0AAD3RY75_NEPGR|nr:hypothetical protein Nepgr_002039 [Nepenthes gracilis]
MAPTGTRLPCREPPPRQARAEPRVEYGARDVLNAAKGIRILDEESQGVVGHHIRRSPRPPPPISLVPLRHGLEGTQPLPSKFKMRATRYSGSMASPELHMLSRRARGQTSRFASGEAGGEATMAPSPPPPEDG